MENGTDNKIAKYRVGQSVHYRSAQEPHVGTTGSIRHNSGVAYVIELQGGNTIFQCRESEIEAATE